MVKLLGRVFFDQSCKSTNIVTVTSRFLTVKLPY